MSIVSASLTWETTAQFVFWQLVHAEGVPVDWILQMISKLQYPKHSEAIAQVYIMLQRFFMIFLSVYSQCGRKWSDIHFIESRALLPSKFLKFKLTLTYLELVRTLHILTYPPSVTLLKSASKLML